MRCSHCCHDFIDMSLHNFSDFLCRQHEEEAIKLISTYRFYHRQICQINRHNRHRKLRHKKFWTATVENHNLTGCHTDSFPASLDSAQCRNGILASATSEYTRLSAVGNYGQRRMFTAHNFGPSACTCSYCGALLWFEERVKRRSTNSNPKISICYQKVKVQLPSYQPAPDYLMDLLNYNGGSVSKEFR